MDNNIRNLLRSELYSASSYVERIFHALSDIAGLSSIHEVRELSSKMSFDLEAFLSTSLLDGWSIEDGIYTQELKQLRLFLKSTTQLTEALLQLPLNTEKSSKHIVEYINLLYQHAQEFHLLCLDMTSIEIQLPRVNLIDIIDDIKEQRPIPRFSLPLRQVTELSHNKLGSISSLEWQRQKNHDQFMQKGHEAIYNKEHVKALENFSKSLNYKETAEILTLIGWAHSLLGKNDKAKSYCLKAIQKDPDYGPPYNDVGTYLMAEGQVDESLKWFELAKSAPNYQNREYPYINAGRAHMSKRNITKALEEFSQALTLAPFHEELHQTVEKLKRSLHKNSEPQNPFPLPQERDSTDLPPPVF
jgi:Tfp pilus assembly protein PilF